MDRGNRGVRMDSQRVKPNRADRDAHHVEGVKGGGWIPEGVGDVQLGSRNNPGREGGVRLQ